MNPHLKHIPRLRPLAAGGLARRHLEGFGGQAHGTFDTQVLRFGTLEELGADLFERLDFAAREGDADLVDFWAFAEILLRLGVGHFALLGVDVEVTWVWAEGIRIEQRWDVKRAMGRQSRPERRGSVR